jgi:hypothetical protein
MPNAEAGRIQRNTTRVQPQEGRAVGAGVLTSRRSKSLISDNDSSPNNSDSKSSSDDDKCSSGDEQGGSSTSKHSR